MKTFIRRALCAVGLTGGVVIVGFGLAQAASADTGSGPVTSGESGILSGNQTGADAQAPVNLSGNQITVIGQRNHTASTGSASTGSASTGTSSTSGSSGSPTTSGQSGIGSGNQSAADVQAPVNASGNQVTVVGQDNTTQSSSTTSTSGSGGSTGGFSGSPTTSGQNGGGSGNQTGVTVLAPVNASCNQVTVVGQDNTDGCASGSSASAPAAGSPTTTGQGGIVSGNQTALGVLLPIDVSGNQVTVIGQDNADGGAGSSTTATGPAGTTGTPTTSGQSGIGSGNQTGLGVTAPISATGDQVTVIGQDNTLTSTGGSGTGGSTGGTGPGQTTNGSGGIGSGNQTPIGVQAPVDTSGNQVTVIGQGNTSTSTGGGTTGGSTGGVVSPPTGGTVTPPTGGTATTVAAPQGSATPGSSVLPNTGLGGALPWLAALGLLLVGLGSLLTRRGRPAIAPGAVRAG